MENETEIKQNTILLLKIVYVKYESIVTTFKTKSFI